MGHLDIIKNLVSVLRANDYQRDGTTVQVASIYGHVEVCGGILHAGEIKGHLAIYGNALHAASAKGHSETVRVLMASGADINEDRIETNLQITQICGSVKFYGGLLLAGKVKGDLIVYGSPLEAAAAEGHLEVVKILLASGVDMEAVRNQKSNLNVASVRGSVITYHSALQAATVNGHQEIVDELMAHSASHSSLSEQSDLDGSFYSLSSAESSEI